MTTLTAVQIPCCLCGTMILPNHANQCPSCLVQEVDLHGLLQRGPGGAHDIVIHQCRQCRYFQVTEKLFRPMEMESPELLAVCLKQIPALTNSHGSSPPIKLLDAMWIWTEPHSMRLKLRLLVRATLQGVDVQQRVPVELKIQFKQCQECNREYTNRTWHALVQLRQKRTDGAPKKGLAALEMAIARNATIRKHVLKIDSTRNGFDFYFLSLTHAQAFARFLAKMAPMKIKTTNKLVSTDVKSNTANMKYTVACDVVPLCRHDLLLVHKKAARGGNFAGRLVVVTKMSSVVHWVDAAPKRSATTMETAELAPETYYKAGGDKMYHVMSAMNRTIRFVVLDVELCSDDHHHQYSNNNTENENDDNDAHKNSTTQGSFALADVVVARESDFGRNDETFRCVTHLGNLLHPGDVVLGYDLATYVTDEDLETAFQSHYVMPDVVLVKKVKERTLQKEADEADAQDEAQALKKGGGRKAKRKEKQRLRNEKKSRELEESALRMGFVAAEEDSEEEDADLEAELAEMEKQMAAMEEAQQHEDDEKVFVDSDMG